MNIANNVTPVDHLTDAQFTDLLLGTIPPSVTAHLEGCAPCAEEAQRVSGAIGNFEQQSRLWAERRASVSHAALVPTRIPSFAWLNRPAAWTAAAAALALATFLSVGHHNAKPIATQQAAQQIAVVQSTPQHAAQAAPATHVSSTTLKADNDLLSAINGELSADATAPASIYGLKVEAHATRKRVSNE